MEFLDGTCTQRCVTCTVKSIFDNGKISRVFIFAFFYLIKYPFILEHDKILKFDRHIRPQTELTEAIFIDG